MTLEKKSSSVGKKKVSKNVNLVDNKEFKKNYLKVLKRLKVKLMI